MTPHHLPFYIAKPGETDVLMIVMGVFLVLAVLGIRFRSEWRIRAKNCNSRS
jgi:hypothetical protein